MVFLSLAIPTYKRVEHLRATLPLLEKEVAQFPDCEIYVSDNASTDGTLGFLQERASRNPQVRFGRNASNVGFDANVRLAVQGSRGEFVWTLGDDDHIRPGALSRVCASLRKGPDVSLLVINWLPKADLPRQEKPMPGTELFAIAGTLLAYLGSMVVRRKQWLASFRPEYAETGFVHLYTALALMKEGTGLLIADQLVETGSVQEVDGHWSLGPESLRILYGDVGRALLYAEDSLGFPKRVVRRALRRHLLGLPRAILSQKAHGRYNSDNLSKLGPVLAAVGAQSVVIRAAAAVPRPMARILLALHSIWRK